MAFCAHLGQDYFASFSIIELLPFIESCYCTKLWPMLILINWVYLSLLYRHTGIGSRAVYILLF